MDELIGIARGVLADGALVFEEARFLLDWLSRNEEVRDDFFGKTLYRALGSCLADNQMDAEEEDQLVNLLLEFTGGTPTKGAERSYSTRLPLCRPVPEIKVQGHSFCFTGKFVFGTRSKCGACVTGGGGTLHKYPIRKTNYLVIGDLGSVDWIHTNSGRKIERAIEIREAGDPLNIVDEASWAKCVAS